jgi:transcriptional regulator with XRE-family HTH domain
MLSDAQETAARPAESLRDLRRNRGLSLRAAASKMGLADPSPLFRAERGAVPNPANAKRIADFFQVQVSDLWPEDPTKQNGPAALDKPGSMTDVHQEDDSAHAL